MDTFPLKVEPGLDQVEEHEHMLQADNFKDENVNQKSTNKETELITSPNTNVKAATKKNRTQNNEINKSHNKKKQPEYLSDFLRKKFLQAFVDSDCTSMCLDKNVKEYNADKKLVKEFFSKAAQGAQAFVHQECDSLCFSNITDWLKHFEALDVEQNSNFESAIIMNAIVNNESLPDAKSTGGVNLKAIYKFISNSLMGLPQKPLNPISGKFLSSEFQNLINEANTEEADNDVRNMKLRLETSLYQVSDQPSSSLDPLKLTDVNELLRVIQTTTLNGKDCDVVKIEK